MMAGPSCTRASRFGSSRQETHHRQAQPPEAAVPDKAADKAPTATKTEVEKALALRQAALVALGPDSPATAEHARALAEARAKRDATRSAGVRPKGPAKEAANKEAAHQGGQRKPSLDG